MADGEGGRPRKYADPEQFANEVEAYLLATDKPLLGELAFTLGFEDRESFVHYETYGPEFSRTVKRARLACEIDRHKRLLDKDRFTPGVIFDLKNNHGWKDKTEQEHSGGMTIGWQTGKPPGT